ncbi:hypothetical protein [Shewanella sp. M-Br]|uniref:hypothetical protein n=1 Tax=Shewanella sp. M-Br TaxID=2495595 RepID=UPI00294911EE|nr:hypothetical protein SMBr_29970 [Shewanella sp. M-Br]
MKVTVEKTGDFIPDIVKNDIELIITSTLNEIKTTDSEFVINDTLCFKVQTNKKITACVTNSATYISNKFQSELAKIPGCEGETKINDQSFDGLIKRTYTNSGYTIKDKRNLLSVIYEYIHDNKLEESMIHTLFPMFYGMYVERDCYDICSLPESSHCLFSLSKKIKSEFKIGVEFETGNVASSFRAINKLGTLFQQGYIDAGVFITSSNRPRIWPTSNRNGSFPELMNRNYEKQISLPLICMGFAPDRYDRSAPYLSRTGELYDLISLEKQDHTGLYNIYLGDNGEEILIPNLI